MDVAPNGATAPAANAAAHTDEQKQRAMAAAMAAAKYAAPGNRERVLNEAMSAALDPSTVAADVRAPQQRGQARSAAPAAAAPAATPALELGVAQIEEGLYEAPEWGEPFPADDDVSLDVMRTGTILTSVPMPPGRSFATFGRHPSADVLVEHPSASRLHAVLQFRGREAFLADCGSTHGTFLNQQTLEPHKYYAVHVGSQFRFGQSTRSYILSAPEVLP